MTLLLFLLVSAPALYINQWIGWLRSIALSAAVCVASTVLLVFRFDQIGVGLDIFAGILLISSVVIGFAQLILTRTPKLISFINGRPPYQSGFLTPIRVLTALCGAAALIAVGGGSLAAAVIIVRALRLLLIHS